MVFYRQEGKICKHILDNIQVCQGFELLHAQNAGVPYVKMEHSYFIQAGLGKFQNIWKTDFLKRCSYWIDEYITVSSGNSLVDEVGSETAFDRVKSL